MNKFAKILPGGGCTSRSVVRFFALTSVFIALFVSVFSYTRIGAPQHAYAATSSNLNYQARLLSSSGNIVPDGYYNVEFKLYGAATGGTALWTERYYDSNGATAGNDSRVRVVNGYLSVNLASVTSFPGSIDWDQDMWLTMNIGGAAQTATPTFDGEMAPRIKLTAVPYAFQAKQATRLSQTQGAFTGTLDFGTLTASRAILLPDEAGTVCLRNSSNCGFGSATGNGNYIQNGTSVQSANFNIQSAAAGNVAAIIKGATGQTADILQVQSGSINSLTVSANGSTTLRVATDNASAFRVQDAGGNNLFVVDSSTDRLAVGLSAVPANGVLTVGANTVAASGGIYFGTDTNLYRSGVGSLKTDSTLYAKNLVTTLANGSEVQLSSVNGAFVDTQATTAGDLSGIIRVGTIGSIRKTGTSTWTSSDTASRYVAGVLGSLSIEGGSIDGAAGVRSTIGLSAGATATNLYAFSSRTNGAGLAGTVANYYGYYAANPTTSGSAITNIAGVYIQTQTGGVNNYGLQFQAGTTPASGITYGTDTNLYRSAANILQTDDSMIISGNLSVQSSTLSTFGGSVQGANAAANNQFVTLGQANSLYSGSSGSGNYIQNGTAAQTADFNVTGSGTIGTLTVTGGGSINGALTVTGSTTLNGGLTVSGGQFTNNASTLNTAAALGNFAANGVVGTAAATVDTKTSLAIAQTTASRILTLPNPTVTTAGRVMYVLNTGSATFSMHGVSIPAGYGQIYIWNGSSWILGASGGGSAITLQSAYDGGNVINTTDGRDLDFILSNTVTDTNFTIDIAPGSSGMFRLQNNGTDIFSIGSAGKLNLAVQGTAGGIAIGGDVTLYRSAASTLTIDDSVILAGTGSNLTVQGTGTSTFAGNVTVTGVITGNGSGLTSLNATNLASGTVNSARITGSYTGITGTGALSVGSIASGFGTIATGNTITGTTINGTTGVNTGAGAGTQRIDSSGNLLNVGSISATGVISGKNILPYQLSSWEYGANGQTVPAFQMNTGQVAGVTISTAESYDGGRSLQLATNSAGADAYAYVSTNNSTPVRPSTKYAYSVYVKDVTGAGSTSSVEAYVRFNNNPTNTHSGFGGTANNTGWTRLTGVFTSPADATSLGLRIDVNAPSRTVLFDAFMLEEIPTSQTTASAYSPSGYMPGVSLSSTNSGITFDGTINSMADLQTSGTTRISSTGVLSNVTADAGIITSGTFGVARGGTGAATLTQYGILYGNGTSAIQATAVGTTGQCLVGATGAAPSWQSCLTASGTNNAFMQGGNSFGGVATLGTNDNYDLVFETGNVEEWRILTTGQLQGNGASTIQTSTGSLTLASLGGNGNIVLTPNGTGNVNISVGGLQIGGTMRISNTGVFTGNGSGLTDLNATNITTGTIADARLSNNVALLNNAQTFTGAKTFSAAGTGLTVTNAASVGSLTVTNGATVGGSMAVAGELYAQDVFRLSDRIRQYTSSYNGTLPANTTTKMGELTFPGNSVNLVISGELKAQNTGNYGSASFVISARANTLPSKTFIFSEDKDGPIPIEILLYEDAATGRVVVAYSSTSSLTNVGWTLTVQDRANNYNYWQPTTAYEVLDTTGLTAVPVTTAYNRTMNGNLGISGNLLTGGTTRISSTGVITATGFTTTGGASITGGLNNNAGGITNAGAISGATGYAQTSGNFSQTGTGTFSTGTGAVSLNGATTVTVTGQSASFGFRNVNSTNGGYIGMLSNASNAAYNSQVQAGDTALIYSNGTQGSGALTIAPWSSSTNGSIRLDASAGTIALNGDVTTNGRRLTSTFIDTQTTNLLANGSFETNTAGWTANVTTLARSTTEGYFGSSSLQMNYSGTGDGYAIYSLPAVPNGFAGRPYTFSFWAKGSEAGTAIGGTYIQTLTPTTSNCSIAPINITTSWQKFSATCTIPTSNTSTSWRAVLRPMTSSTATMYVDGISVQYGTVGTEYSNIATTDSGNTILYDGNLGIGTNTPGQKLDVQGGNINTSGSIMTGGTARISSTGVLSSVTADAGIITTGTLPVARGGTGAGTFTQYGIVYGDGTNSLKVTAAGAAGQCFVGNTGAAPTWQNCATAISGFVQGGNSFGGVATLGTNDNYDLVFETGNVEEWRILTTGEFQGNGASTIQASTGNLTLASLAGNGNVILTPNGTGNVNITVGGLQIGGTTRISSTGVITATGFTTTGGASITGGLNNNAGGITNAGAISGATGYAQTSGNFSQTGTGTFSTGTGAVGLNGNTTISAGGSASTFTGWTSANTDIDALIPGSASGALLQTPANAHFTVGLRENNSNDSFSIISGGGNYSVDSIYDTVVLFAGADGNVGIGTSAPGQKLDVQGGNINTSGSIMTGGTARISNLGAFTGTGAGLTALNATNVSSGTLGDTYLSTNVALLNNAQTFTGVKTFSAAGTGLAVTNNATVGGTLTVTGAAAVNGGLTVSGGMRVNSLVSGVYSQLGRFGSSDNGSTTAGRWIKLGDADIADSAWGGSTRFEMEVMTDGDEAQQRQLVSVFVRNSGTDLNTPQISLTTLEGASAAIPSIIRDVKLVRTAGTGITGNTVSVWVQLGSNNYTTNKNATFRYSGNWTAGPHTSPQPSVTAISDTGTQYGINNYNFGSDLTIAGNVGIGSMTPGQKLDVQGGNINTSGSLMTGGIARISSTGVLSNVTADTGILTSGTLGVARGGTGAATLTQYGILYGNSTGAIQATAVGTAGQCLVGNTGAAPTWQSCATTSGASNAFMQGGNSFGGLATIGTNDAYDLVFETGNVEEWRILTTGQLQGNGASTVQTSTGSLTLASLGGNGNIVLTPNGTGNVNISSGGLQVGGTIRISNTGAFTGTGLTTTGGASISGGLNNNAGGITNAGAISGATTVVASGTVTGSQLVSTIAAGTAPLQVTSTTMVGNLNAQYLGGYTESQLGSFSRSNNMISGGGTVGYNSPGTGVSWSQRMIVISNSRGADFATNGYFDIDMPANGTVITGANTANITVAGGAIPLGTWCALYYILPVGATNTTLPANFRTVCYSGTNVSIPSSWVLVASHNSDNATMRFGNGLILRSGQTGTAGSVNNAVFNSSVTTATLQNAGNLDISATGANQINFNTNGALKWSILSGGEFQGNGASTVRSSTGNLNLTSAGGNGNIVLTPNGTGNVNITVGGLQIGGTTRISSTGVLSSVTADANIITTGTLADARLNTRLGTVSSTVTDWNNASENGWYMGYNATNAPTTGTWYMGDVVRHNALWVTQTVHEFTADGSTNTATYRRSSSDGGGTQVWTAWYKLQLSQAEQDARYAATSGSTNYIQNGTAAQTGNFNVTGTGTVGALTVTGAATVTNNLTVNGGINTKGYPTSGTSNLYTGQWTRIASCTIVSQYADCRSQATMVGTQDGGSMDRATIDIRVKQQNAMGGAPYVSIDMYDNTAITPSDVVAVTTSNTASSTVVELYGRINGGYKQWNMAPLINTGGGTSFVWQASQPFVASLPAGTQTVATYAESNATTVTASGNINTSGGALQTNGVTRITNAGVIQNATFADASTFFTGGTLGVARGGTGAATLTQYGVLYGNSTGAIQATAVGTTGQCLVGNSGAAPTWQSCATASGGNNAFMQGGNSFTAAATIGTNDAYDLIFETGNVEEWRILTTGEFQGNGASVVRASTGNLTLASNGGNGNIMLTPNGSGSVRSSGEVISTSQNAFRMVNGSYGSFFRNDGSSTYFLLTASGDTYGSWNTLRPLTINNVSGLTSIGNGLSVLNGLTVASGASISSGLNNNSGGITNAGAISGATTVTASGNINSTGGAIQTSNTTRIDASGNLSSIGTYTGSGNFTTTGGVLSVQGTGTSTFSGSLAVNGSVKAGSTIWGVSTLGSAPASTTYYKIATLPTSNAGTHDHIQISGVLDQGWSGASKVPFTVTMGNRNAFGAKYELSGSAPTGARIMAYTEADGSVSVYAMHLAAQYTTITYDITQAINVVTYQNPAATTAAPTGTLVFDTSTSAAQFAIDNSGNLQLAGVTRISSAGAATLVGIANSASYVQSGSSANTFTGATTFSAAGTGLTVTNAATIGGTLTVGSDTNLYRKSANLLATDDSFALGGELYVGGQSPSTFINIYAENNGSSQSGIRLIEATSGTNATRFELGLASASDTFYLYDYNNLRDAITLKDNLWFQPNGGKVNIGGGTNSGLFNVGANTTDAANGVYFGNDTNLYRSAAGTLKTDGNIVVNGLNASGAAQISGNLTVNGTTTLRNTTNSTAAFNVQNSAGTTLLGVDTTNSKIFSNIANGATASGFTLNTTNSYTTTGAKLLSIQNAGAEKFAVDKDGLIATPSVGPQSMSAPAVGRWSATGYQTWSVPYLWGTEQYNTRPDYMSRTSMFTWGNGGVQLSKPGYYRYDAIVSVNPNGGGDGSTQVCAQAYTANSSGTNIMNDCTYQRITGGNGTTHAISGTVKITNTNSSVFTVVFANGPGASVTDNTAAMSNLSISYVGGL